MKTPVFDAALAEMYASIQPHERVCTETGDRFLINQRDIEMYRSLKVPLPTVSVLARFRRQRIVAAGFDLFRRLLPDGSTAISMYDPESSVPILPTKQWFSDAFDPIQYGREYQFGQSFFDQWLALSNAVPRPAMIEDPSNENSPWAVYGYANKDCYFTYEGLECEGLTYSDYNVACKFCVDASTCYRSTNCLEVVNVLDCSRVVYSDRCSACINCTFCLACRDCSDCFGCTNLKGKRFCFFNEQLTEEEYRKRLHDIDLKNADVFEDWRKKAVDEWNKAFRKAGTMEHCENSIGDDLHHCKQVEGVSIEESERVYHGFGMTRVKDTIDHVLGLELERCVNLVRTVRGYENKMVNQCEGCIDIEYSDLLTSCEHCFGCIGLKHKKFCVFNKQYSEEEYWPLVDRIKTEMLKTGEYGEFFPYRVSPWAYNTSHADAMFPLNEMQAKALGARWYSFAEEKSASALPIDQLPTHLDAFTDEMCSTAYLCPVSGRSFRIVKPELELHRALGIALPRVHPKVRHRDHMDRLFPVILSKRVCADCHQEVASCIPKTHPSPIVCELCYEKRILNQ